jgi:hypothetical protein
MEVERVMLKSRVRRFAASFAGTEYDEYATDVLVGSPDYIVYVPRRRMDILGDTYNDHFQVFTKPDGSLFAAWTQATREGHVDQHIAFSRSTDKGLTWTEPLVLAGSANHCNPQLLASWQQPMLSASGRIYVLWNQQTTSRGPHCGRMFGKYSDDDGETWSAPKMVPMQRMAKDPEDITVPPSWCNWQRPLRLGAGNKYLVGVSRHGKAAYETQPGCTVEFLQFDNIDEDPEVQDIELRWFASNEKAMRVEHETFGSTCEEAAIVKLPDGRLFALMRTCAGYPAWTQSRDHGVTWSDPKPLRDRDGGMLYKHPRSPCPIYDWKGCEAGSGYYFAFVHNTFDPEAKSAYQTRGPLYLIAGTFQKDAEQPIWFAPMKLFIDRPSKNSFYTSMDIVDGNCVLWFNDKKYYLLGRVIDDGWFTDAPEIVR